MPARHGSQRRELSVCESTEGIVPKVPSVRMSQAGERPALPFVGSPVSRRGEPERYEKDDGLGSPRHDGSDSFADRIARGRFRCPRVVYLRCRLVCLGSSVRCVSLTTPRSIVRRSR